jgi:hypothetical protein
MSNPIREEQAEQSEQADQSEQDYDESWRCPEGHTWQTIFALRDTSVEVECPICAEIHP